MTHEELIETLREEARELAAKAKWYRSSACTHLFELHKVEHRTMWEAIGLVEGAKSKSTLVAELENKLRATGDEPINYFILHGLNQLAEFSYMANKVYYRVAYDVELLNEF